MSHSGFRLIETEHGVPIKAWIKGVPFDPGAEEQLRKTAQLPIIHKWIAVMPDVHKGLGATVGSVVPTKNAIIPAAVGVDIGCGMMAVRTTLNAAQLPENLRRWRTAIEKAVPHGRTSHGGRRDKGSWQDVPNRVSKTWAHLSRGFQAITEKHPRIAKSNNLHHLGTLGTGNHFIEVCLDEEDRVWIMLHSGSRGVGNRIGSYFIELAKNDMRGWIANLPDKDLAYLREGTEHFDDYVEAVSWAQEFARHNRAIMMDHVLGAIAQLKGVPAFKTDNMAVNCHHNYVNMESHFGEDVWVTRKGAVRAGEGELGIIPGSMGARSFIVRGRGNPDSFHSCSHGAGRVMSRTKAKKRFTLDDHIKATEGIECRKDTDVIDETPAAYKPIDSVIAAQSDLVEVLHTLRQVVCVKG
ncbi:RtcB family protein [Sulfidibacter corallicola]|uniref:3'-phosphate/5'-hydroxy nucleic acid ligase n=1 Tax=Sulfidibacter corallicola TaxID=2818388 RepID=A0A8A4TXA4_SULCO|nr:RtcB family protein [Sulfidibacter corallicola]QTD53744.1 RtcB family protein [Sulfidibacter corallicola]